MEPLLLDASDVTSDASLRSGFLSAAHQILSDLVGAGAALGWIDRPPRSEVEALFEHVFSAAQTGDAALRAAYVDGHLVGLGYWLRYTRATHRPHADLQKIAVAAGSHGHGVGRAVVAALVADAQRTGIEVLTLDARGDNRNALHLYRSLGFTEYGRLRDFVTVGGRRYDKVMCALDLRGRAPGPAAVPRESPMHRERS